MLCPSFACKSTHPSRLTRQTFNLQRPSSHPHTHTTDRHTDIQTERKKERKLTVNTNTNNTGTKMPSKKSARGAQNQKRQTGSTPARPQTQSERDRGHADAIADDMRELMAPQILEAIKNTRDDYAPTTSDNKDPAAHTAAVERFRALIPQPRFDEGWTEDDEAELVERAEGDAEFNHLCTFESHIGGVFKTAYKFMNCLATDIIGPKTLIKFVSDHATSKHRRWARAFCTHLQRLIVQAVFGRNPAKLALAIQWAVICRTKDRRRWRLSGCDDEFLRILAAVVDKHQDGSKSPKLLRRMALEIFRSKYPGREDSVWCQLLQRIGEVVASGGQAAAGHNSGPDDEGFRFYEVNSTDLTNICDAIREMKMCSFPMYHDPTAVAAAVLFSRHPLDLPYEEEVVEATRAVILSRERECLRALESPTDRSSKTPS